MYVCHIITLYSKYLFIPHSLIICHIVYFVNYVAGYQTHSIKKNTAYRLLSKKVTIEKVILAAIRV